MYVYATFFNINFRHFYIELLFSLLKLNFFIVFITSSTHAPKLLYVFPFTEKPATSLKLIAFCNKS